MAITAANLTSGQTANNYGSPSVTTASISPSANTLLIISVAGYKAAGFPNATPTISGLSLTWSQIIDQNNSTGAGRSVTLFGALTGSSPGSGTVTITYGTTNQNNISWSIDQFSGTVVSSVASAIVQSVGNSVSGTNTGITVTLASFASTNNAAYGFLRYNTTGAVSVGSGFTSLSNNSGAIGSDVAEWEINNNSVNWTWTSISNNSSAAAIEISALSTGPSTPSIFSDEIVDAPIKRLNIAKQLNGDVIFPALLWINPTTLPSTFSTLIVESQPFFKRKYDNSGDVSYPGKILLVSTPGLELLDGISFQSYSGIIPSPINYLVDDNKKLIYARKQIKDEVIYPYNLGQTFFQLINAISVPSYLSQLSTPFSDEIIDTIKRPNVSKQLNGDISFPSLQFTQVIPLTTFFDLLIDVYKRPNISKQLNGDIAFPPLPWTAKTPSTFSDEIVDAPTKRPNIAKQLNGDISFSVLQILPNIFSDQLVDIYKRPNVSKQLNGDIAFPPLQWTAITPSTFSDQIVDSPTKRPNISKQLNGDIVFPALPWINPAVTPSLFSDEIVDAPTKRTNISKQLNGDIAFPPLQWTTITPSTFSDQIVDSPTKRPNIVRQLNGEISYSGLVPLSFTYSSFNFICKKPIITKQLNGDIAFPPLPWTAITPSIFSDEIVDAPTKRPNIAKQLNGDIIFPALPWINPTTLPNAFSDELIDIYKRPNVSKQLNGDIAFTPLPWTAKTPSIFSDEIVDAPTKRPNISKQLNSDIVFPALPWINPTVTPSLFSDEIVDAPTKRTNISKQLNGDIAFPPLPWTVKTPSTFSDEIVDAPTKRPNIAKQLNGDIIFPALSWINPTVTPSFALDFIIDSGKGKLSWKRDSEIFWCFTSKQIIATFETLSDLPPKKLKHEDYLSFPPLAWTAKTPSNWFDMLVDMPTKRPNIKKQLDGEIILERLPTANPATAVTTAIDYIVGDYKKQTKQLNGDISFTPIIFKQIQYFDLFVNTEHKKQFIQTNGDISYPIFTKTSNNWILNPESINYSKISRKYDDISFVPVSAYIPWFQNIESVKNKQFNRYDEPITYSPLIVIAPKTTGAYFDMYCDGTYHISSGCNESEIQQQGLRILTYYPLSRNIIGGEDCSLIIGMGNC